MVWLRVILLSQIVFTITSAVCCGKNKDKCGLTNCVGVVCTSDSDCGGICCIGRSSFFERYCGACHKTRNCELVIGGICRKKCCGSDDFHLKCLSTCQGIACTKNDHCDGECCVGDFGKKTCVPCHKTPPPCTRNLDCPSNCCKFGTCFPRKGCLSPTRPSTPQPTTKRQCTWNFDCFTNCCKFGSCERKEMCLFTDRPTNPPTVNEKHCTWNIDCATNCCQFEKCVPRENCHSTDSSPSKASGSVDSKTVIAIAVPIAGILFLVILSVVVYVLLIRGHKGTSHPAPPTVDNDARQVTYHKVGDAGNSSGVAL